MSHYWSLVEDLDSDHSILNLSTKPTDTHGRCSPTQSYDKTSQYEWSVAGNRKLLGRFRSPALCHVLLSTGSPLPRRAVGRCSPSVVQVAQILKNDLFGMHLPLGSLSYKPISVSWSWTIWGLPLHASLALMCPSCFPQNPWLLSLFGLLECEFVTPSLKVAAGDQMPTGRCAVRVRRQELGVPDIRASHTTYCWLWLCHLPECSHTRSSQLTVCTNFYLR